MSLFILFGATNSIIFLYFLKVRCNKKIYIIYNMPQLKGKGLWPQFSLLVPLRTSLAIPVAITYFRKEVVELELCLLLGHHMRELPGEILQRGVTSRLNEDLRQTEPRHLDGLLPPTPLNLRAGDAGRVGKQVQACSACGEGQLSTEDLMLVCHC